jgi:hypothetical protein
MAEHNKASSRIKEKPKMKKNVMTLVGVVTVCVLLGFMSNAMAEDANHPKNPPKENPKDSERLVIGIVEVVKDNNNVTEIKVVAHKNLIYQVTLDEKGKELAKLADKKARITGIIETKGDVQWLTVKTFSDVKAGAEAKPKAKSKEKPAGKPAAKPDKKKH